MNTERVFRATNGRIIIGDMVYMSCPEGEMMDNLIIEKIPDDATECRVYLDDATTVTVLIVDGINLVPVAGRHNYYHEVARGDMFELAWDNAPGWFRGFIIAHSPKTNRIVTDGEALHRAYNDLHKYEDQDYEDLKDTEASLRAGL